MLPLVEKIQCSLLITAAQLASRLDQRRNLIIIEIASSADVRRAPERIPGSQRVWRPDYQLPMDEAQPLDGLCPTPTAFEAFARAHGINDDTTVVIIDRKYDATRLWWLFVLFGKSDIMILDGGYQAWVAGGYPMTLLEPPCPAYGSWSASLPDRRLLAMRDDVRQLSDAAASHLWDVRSIEEFTGSTVLPGATAGGRIPWATARVDWDLLRDADGTWRSVEEVRQIVSKELGASSDDGTVHTFYCQSGVRTTQLIFGLHRAGWPLETLRNYDGSWVEWSHLADEGEIWRPS